MATAVLQQLTCRWPISQLRLGSIPRALVMVQRGRLLGCLGALPWGSHSKPGGHMSSWIWPRMPGYGSRSASLLRPLPPPKWQVREDREGQKKKGTAPTAVSSSYNNPLPPSSISPAPSIPDMTCFSNRGPMFGHDPPLAPSQGGGVFKQGYRPRNAPTIGNPVLPGPAQPSNAHKLGPDDGAASGR